MNAIIYNRDISDEVWEDLHNDVHHFFWSNVIYDKEVPAAELSDDEKQALLDEMPEIVFVMSEHYDENICGFYVTKTGEIKMYDFRNIAPDEIYDINDVYDRLEEAGCGSVVPKTGATEYYLPADSTGTVDTDTLIRSYIRLKEATAGAKTVYTQEKLEHTPDCRYYGIRNSADGTEIILLGGGGADHELISTDKYVNRLCSDIVPWFPRMLLYP